MSSTKFLGAIDGTTIKIKEPSYVGRNPGHFINYQVVCDHNLKFVDAVVKLPGSVNGTTAGSNRSWRVTYKKCVGAGS